MITLLITITIGKTRTIYLSADRTGAVTSGNSIEQGIIVALSEVDYKIGNDTIVLRSLDHRGSTPRFEMHCEQFLADTTAIAMYGGLHSPPLLAMRDMINREEILTLVSWAAAGPITRYPDSTNWIFRLSVDDSKAGEVITAFALSEGITNPTLLLEETGWGTSNENTMTNALANQNIEPSSVEWFNWGISDSHAKIVLRRIHQSGADAIFLVANASEGITFARAMAELPLEERLPIRSHWGITGGSFTDSVSSHIRDSIDLLFIQSTFSFCPLPDDRLAESVIDRAITLFPEINEACNIKAPVGFIHSYDLTRIFLEAMRSVDSDAQGVEYRRLLRDALENCNEPVEGLIKEYRAPFSVWSNDHDDAHEALDISDWTMARYRNDNSIEIVTDDK